MGYTSRRGRRPDEYASKASHVHVVKDEAVQHFLSQCELPKSAEEVSFDDHCLLRFIPVPYNPIRHVIAVDGGYTEVPVRAEFPSATLCFFQFGALTFSVEDLDNVTRQPFIDPDDMAKLKKIQRLELTLPVRNIRLKTEATLTQSVRRALYDFFRAAFDGELIDTLKWFLFQEYEIPLPVWTLARCPVCQAPDIPLQRANISRDCTFTCEHCHGTVFLTDVFRLQEAVDDEVGAGGILGYVTVCLEQFIVVHALRLLLRSKPALLDRVLFVKDGPLAFFGQTANMHKPMRALVRFLFSHHNLYLAGLEKSGAFVDHADEIAGRLENGTILILDNDYIYKYVLPGRTTPSEPYGRTTYYGNKIIFKTQSGSMYVVSLPTAEAIASPTEADFHNLHSILTNIEKLRCDMYDNSLVPIALVNDLVSLASYPSAKILQRFAKDAVNQ